MAEKNKRKVSVILGQINKYTPQLNQATKDYNSFQKNVTTVFNKISLSSSVLLAGGFVAAAAGVGILARSTANMLEKMGQFSDRIGISVEALSQYKLVAELSGITFETLKTAFQRQVRRVSEAEKGYGSAKNALEELRLSAVDLKQLAPEKQFELIAEKLKAIPSHADQVRLAMSIWDTEGVALLQIVNQDISAMRKLAEATGSTFTRADADRAAKFNTELAVFDATLTNLKSTLAIHFLPTLTRALEMMNKFAAMIPKPIDPIEKLEIRLDSMRAKLKALSDPGTLDFFSAIEFDKGTISKLKEGIAETEKALEQLIKARDKFKLSIIKTAPIETEEFEKGLTGFITALEDVSTKEKEIKFENLVRRATTVTEVLQAQAKVNEDIAGRNIDISSRQAGTIVANNKIMAMSERSKQAIFVSANKAMTDQVLTFIETNKFSAKEFAKVVVQTTKAELAGLSARAGVQAIFQTAMGFATAFTNPWESAAHFTAAGNFAAISGAALVGAAAIQQIAGDSPGGPAERARIAKDQQQQEVVTETPSEALDQTLDFVSSGETARTQDTIIINLRVDNLISPDNLDEIMEHQLFPSIRRLTGRDVVINVGN